MYIKIRLYKKYDLDLCKLYISRPRHFTKQLGDALRAYYRNRPFQADFPVVSLKDPPNVIEIKLLLDDELDADIIGNLKSLIPKQRNSFIKKLFRHYLNFDTLQLFMLNTADFGKFSQPAVLVECTAQNVTNEQIEPKFAVTEPIPEKEASSEPVSNINTYKEKSPSFKDESPSFDEDMFSGFDSFDNDDDLTNVDNGLDDEDAYQAEISNIFAGLLG